MPSLASATLLLAHGSSDPRWCKPFTDLLDQLRVSLPNERLELAFMELAEPSLRAQVTSLVQEQITDIKVLPLFFAAGRHLRRDVPLQLEELKQQFARQGIMVSISLHNPIGMEAEVINAIGQVVLRTLER